MPLPRSHCQLLLLVPSICPISVSSPNPRWNAPGSLGVSNRLSFVFVSIVLYIPALFSIWNTFSHSMIISYGSFNLVPVSCSLPDPFSQNYFLLTLTSQRFHSIPFLWYNFYLRRFFFFSIYCVSGIYPGTLYTFLLNPLSSPISQRSIFYWCWIQLGRGDSTP